MSPKNLNLLLGAAALALAMAAPLVSGQSFPAKPVRIVVGFPSGGNGDIPTRIAATNPEQFAEFVKAEIAKWAKVVKEAGITAY